VLELLGARAEEKEIDALVRMTPGCPRLLDGDAGRVRQILVNLVGNAIKFTSQGRVVVEAECLERSGNESLIRLAVHDTGPGIRADVVPQLFQSFSQGDSSTTRKFGGTGLGLAITRRLAEAMGGSAGVSSTEGKGSTFWVTLRMTVGKALPGRAPARAWCRDRRRARWRARGMLRPCSRRPATSCTAESAPTSRDRRGASGQTFAAVVVGGASTVALEGDAATIRGALPGCNRRGHRAACAAHEQRLLRSGLLNLAAAPVAFVAAVAESGAGRGRAESADESRRGPGEAWRALVTRRISSSTTTP
jgi:hypothetical protein